VHPRTLPSAGPWISLLQQRDIQLSTVLEQWPTQYLQVVEAGQVHCIRPVMLMWRRRVPLLAPVTIAPLGDSAMSVQECRIDVIVEQPTNESTFACHIHQSLRTHVHRYVTPCVAAADYVSAVR
jgi:hypothetical protein